ncbi:ATP-binding protein [Poseidonibacter ostreae]|uniref:histidine kinase n=1 Tax=Poseidonibacter ostreae TaxID=2654171 RepID=A0A6L4WVN0_9BACT|nr:ATP-binding protein [Poseidonibacter ostreae]KAB7887283.1 HAMP domain-containing protein [Poseidonibacter ostreae]KAB7890874.1 HAMP domain-containing protein [Poseidonibacter ostreae]
MKLLLKITTLILVALISILSIFAYFQIKDEKKVLSNFLNTQGKLLSNTISAGTIETILIEDYPLLDSYLNNTIKSFETIVYIKITKDDILISSAKNKNLKDDEKKLFFNDITIDGDVIAKLEIGLSTKNNKAILNNIIKKSLSLILVVSLVLFLLMIFIVKKLLLERIEKIKNHTKLISLGIYNKSLSMKTSDEFEDLANDINFMSNRINDSNKHSKTLTLKLKTQAKELIEVIKTKDMFLANMSHELKTPLNSINVISSIMKKNKEENLTNKQIENLNIINLCGHNLLYLINDVLDISKLEMGEIKINYQTFDFNKLIKEISSTIKPLAEEKGIDFKSIYDNKIRYIYSDDNRVKQIIKNFLSNSLKFCEKGKIELKVVDNNEYVNISVNDNGIGIAKNKVADIFDRFKQVDGSITRKYGGSGLGLSISKELAKLLEAEIIVQSEVNKGSTFTLKLPKNMNKVEIKSIEDIKDSTQKEKVLILSNDFIKLMQLVITLQKKFEVIQITDLLQFKEELKKDYKYIILDSEMICINDIKETNLEIIILSDNQDVLDPLIKKMAKSIFKKTNNQDEISSSLLN